MKRDLACPLHNYPPIHPNFPFTSDEEEISKLNVINEKANHQYRTCMNVMVQIILRLESYSDSCQKDLMCDNEKP